MAEKINDDYVRSKLIEYEKQLGRAIRRTDISTEKVGFSMIVINRIWGSLGKCKEDLGLLETPKSIFKPFDYYKNILDIIVDDCYRNSGRKMITWSDIEHNNLKIAIDHKSLIGAFKREGLDIFKYLKDKGFQMNPSSFSFHYTLDSGERVLSTMEYDLSVFLNNDLNLRYDLDYHRDVMYKTFLAYRNNSKLNCDYEFIINNDLKLYVEVAGLISNKFGDWKTKDFGNEKNNKYRDKMILKENLLKNNNLNYLFLFKNDFDGNDYKNKISIFLKRQVMIN